MLGSLDPASSLGSLSGATSACILASRIMKLVAEVSSSMKRAATYGVTRPLEETGGGRITRLPRSISWLAGREGGRPPVPPASSASMMEAAWEVDPDASSLLNSVVRRPKGRWSIKGEMSQHVTARPSSART